MERAPGLARKSQRLELTIVQRSVPDDREVVRSEAFHFDPVGRADACAIDTSRALAHDALEPELVGGAEEGRAISSTCATYLSRGLSARVSSSTRRAFRSRSGRAVRS